MISISARDCGDCKSFALSGNVFVLSEGQAYHRSPSSLSFSLSPLPVTCLDTLLLQAAEEGDNSAGVPSSWGGRPTFSQILKQQEEAAAAEAAAHAAAGTTPPAVATTAPASAPKKPTPASQHPNASGNRPQGGHKNQDKSGAPHKSHSPAAGTAAGAAAKNKLVTNPDGTWVRDKLPPR
jgi:hypothetical protein